MVEKFEASNYNLEISELLQLREELSSLYKEVKEGIEPSVTKGPEKLKNGKVLFDYKEKSGQKREIITEKSGTSYKIRVKKWVKLSNGQMGWQTQKNKNSETFNFTATNKESFNQGLSNILNKTIGTNRDKLPKTGEKVYNLLNSSGQGSSEKKNEEKKESNESKRTDLKKKPVDLKYSETNKEKKLQIEYPQNTQSVEGRITRCLRFASITDAVENRYGIPRGLLMALMAQEGWGDPTVINKRINYKYVGKNKGNLIKESYKDKKGNVRYRYKNVGKGKGDYSIDENKSCDGGAGLIHIQAANAAAYGLKTLPRSTTGMVDYSHGEKLEKAKKDTGNNLAKLSKLDDRFNPILSVDVTARYLMEYCGGKNKTTGDGWMEAICKYAGRGMQDYGYPVLVYWTTINKVRGNNMPAFKNKEINKVINGKVSAKVNGQYEKTDLCIERTKKAIDKLNPKIDGKEVSVGEVLKYLKGQWENYGLKEYKNHNKEHPYTK